MTVQNLKVDIIYHQSPSDFEMEFNLGSSCHMRILSDRTADKKSFIKALARDVARSRVIICCGPLFSKDGLIHMVSKAIGSGTSLCDNKTYGINSDEPINIIAGSTPLVTPDGYFGGCIIECGPQTIILLTENKAFRKAIMKNLIHPYMSEISYIMPDKANGELPDSTKNSGYDSNASDDEAYLTQKDDDYDTDDAVEEQSQLPVDVEDGEYTIDFVMDAQESDAEDTQTEEAVIDEENIDMFTTLDTDEDTDETYEIQQTQSEEDDMFISERVKDIAEQKLEKKANMRAMDITIIALALLLLLAILALVYLIVLRPISMGVGVGDYLKEIFGLVSNNTLV